MVKFIDGNKKYSLHDNEIVVRCSCGSEILSIGMQTHPDQEDKVNLSVLYYTIPNGKIKKAHKNGYMMVFPSKDAILLFYKLLKGEINEGNGGVVSLNGGIIAIQRDYDNKNQLIGADLIGFPSEHSFIKYNKSGNIEKYSAWLVVLDVEEFEKFVEEFEKMIFKKFPELNTKKKKVKKDEIPDNN